MTVELWMAKRPWDHQSEIAAVRDLAHELDQLDGRYHIFANFNVPNAQIDMAVLTRFGIYLVEVKHSAGLPIQGSRNGKWMRQDGREIDNPINQIIKNYWKWRDWLKENQHQFLSENRVASLRANDRKGTFPDIKKFVALYPTKHPDTRIEGLEGEYQLNPMLGDLIGFDQLAVRIQDPAWHCDLGIELADDEIRGIAEQLGLFRVDINSLESEQLTTVNPSDGSESRTGGDIPWWKQGARWALIGLGVMALAMAVYFLIREPHPECGVNVAQVSESDVGRKLVVNLLVDQVEKSDYGPHVMMYAAEKPRGKFSIEIDVPENNVEAGKERFVRWEGKRIIVGRAELGAESRSSGYDPQFNFPSPDEAERLIQDGSDCQ